MSEAEQRILKTLHKYRDLMIDYGRSTADGEPVGYPAEWDDQATKAIMGELEIEKAAETVETAEAIWAIYSAPSRIPGEKMFDFDKWLPGQIEDWKQNLRQLKSNKEG